VTYHLIQSGRSHESWVTGQKVSNAILMSQLSPVDAFVLSSDDLDASESFISLSPRI
jgi:hypothetical protein